jgi:uncharacterized phage protein gp47/JayE
MTQPAQPLYTYISKTAQQIRDDQLRTFKNGLLGLSPPVTNPNIGPGSDVYLRFTAVANEIAVGQANNVLAVDQTMPDTAGGANLDRWLAIVNLSRRGATQSFGLITIQCSVASTPIVTGTQLTDSSGLRYEVSVGGNYGNNVGGSPALQVPVISIDTGKAVNHANGDPLTWTTPPPYVAAQALVGTTGGQDGLTGGLDSEVGVDEPPRARLLSTLQNPPKGGNSAQVAQWANASTPDVQAAFVYPAFLGPATVAFAVTAQPQTTGALSSTSKTRALPATTVSGTVTPYVQGQLPEHALCVGTATVDQITGIAILLSLPSAPTAAPPGPGGGWLDGSPWPSSNSGGTAPTIVSAVTSETVFTVAAPTPPQPGVSHISWISPFTWQILTATVLSYTGSSGAYVVTVDTPWPNLAAAVAEGAAYVFPQSVNQNNYLAAVLGAFAGLGPGEWLPPSNTLISRAFRHPLPSLAWPNALDARFLKQIINSGPEVFDANWISRITTGGRPIVSPYTPDVPAAPVTVTPAGVLLSAPPNIWVPLAIGFYAN